MSRQTSPPNVAVFASSFFPHLGGVEELSRRLAVELRHRGSDTVIVTNRFPMDLPEHEVVDNIPVYRPRFRFPDLKPRHLAGWVVGTTATRRSIRRVVSKHKSSLIHVQCVSTNGYYALRAARSAGVPLVVTLQGELTMDAGQAYQRSAVVRRSWRRLLAAADVVTGCSQQVVDEAVAEFGAGLEAKIRVIRNGVDLAAVRKAEPEKRTHPYVLGIGRFVPQKGFDLLINAFDQVAADHPDLDLVLAGDGPERGRLETQARQTRFADRFAFLGGVPAARAFSLFAGASAFVLSSRHEPQGIVVAEAMAAGAPVLATRVGGVPETVRDGVNGLLVAGGDADLLADGLRRLLNDRVAARVRAEQAEADITSYDWSSIADEYELCYADAVKTSGTSGREASRLPRSARS